VAAALCRMGTTLATANVGEAGSELRLRVANPEFVGAYAMSWRFQRWVLWHSRAPTPMHRMRRFVRAWLSGPVGEQRSRAGPFLQSSLQSCLRRISVNIDVRRASVEVGHT